MIGQVFACKMGLQIPYCICTQVPQKEAVRKVSESSRRNNSGIMSATRSRIVGRAFDAGPYPHVPERSTQVQHSFCDRFSEGQKCGTDPSHSAGQAKSIRSAFLGQRILCQHSWVG